MPFEPGEGGNAYLGQVGESILRQAELVAQLPDLATVGEGGPPVRPARAVRDDRIRPEVVRRVSVMSRLVGRSGKCRYVIGVHAAKVAR